MEKEKEFELWESMLDRKDYHNLRVIMTTENEADIAEFIQELPEKKAIPMFRSLPKELAAEVFSNLPPEVQQLIVSSITDTEIAEIVEELCVDDAVDLVEELPANVVKRVLRNATPETRKLINQFLQYPENSVGSIMTVEFIDLQKTMTVQDAFKRIRRNGEYCESIYTCYVIDDSRTLEGVITARELLLADEDDIIEELMTPDVISTHTMEDQEEAVHQMMKYDFLSLPVTDNENKLVGIVTVDDVMDVMEDEATEDFEKMAAMLPSEKPYLKTSVFVLARNRIVWLLVLMISSMITGSILENFEAAFAVIPLLVTFIPMLTDTGGNAGSQSSTMVIRGMAVGEIKTRDFFRVMFKEMRVSLIVGVALSLVNFIRLIIMYPGQLGVALTVAIALFATVVISKTIGGTLPMLAKALHMDPAIMAAPLITTIVDAVSLVIYFSVATSLLAI